MGQVNFSDKNAEYCIAGKNNIAVACLAHLLELGIPTSQLSVVLCQGDDGRSTWQRSLGFYAKKWGVPIRSLDEVKGRLETRFLSVEFDRIIKPSEFQSKYLYNLHFSKLPAYRGVATSVWPILKQEEESGVTFHRIDTGVDTGPIICQRIFALRDSWTARELYDSYLAEGALIFREAFSILTRGVEVETPQDDSKASLYRRRDLDYGALSLDLNQNTKEFLAQIRAYSFWEYQLPLLGGRKVWSASILPGAPAGHVGHLRNIDKWHARLSLIDGELEIWFSPYDALFAWAKGGVSSDPMDLSAVPNLDLQDAQGWSALMQAAHFGNIQAIQKLIAGGAAINSANLRGTTPLMYAFSRAMNSGDSAALREMLNLGANAELCDQHGKRIADYYLEVGRLDLLSDFPEIHR